MKNNFNSKPHFPFTYGEEVQEDGERLSDLVVTKLSDKKTQRYLGAVAGALFALGSHAGVSNAIPPEYGEAATNAVEGVNQAVPQLGQAAGVADVGAGVADVGANAGAAANAVYGNPIPNGLGHVGQAGNMHFQNPPRQPQQPIKVPAWRLPPAPVTPVGQYANTVVLIASVGWICLNGAWGNPLFMGGCIGILSGLVNEGRKIIFN